MEDSTDRFDAARELRDNRAFLKSLIDNAPVAIYVKDVRPATYGTMLVWNKRFEVITGIAASDVIGRKDEEVLSRIVLDTIRERDREMFADPVVNERDDDPYRRRDGTLIFLHTISVPLLGPDGKPEFILRISEDVTARRRQQKELHARTAQLEALTQKLSISEHRLRTITDTMPAMIAYIDRDERYQFTNAAFERAFGIERDQLRGQTIRELVGDALYAEIKPWVDRVFMGETVTFERRRIDPDGSARWIEATYIPEESEHGHDIVGFHAMLHDITQKKLEAERLLRLSQIDPLTGLANRTGLEQRLVDAMEAARASGEPLALMYIDIDRFKRINDTYGHAAGDALLIEFSARLKSLMRKSDIVARLGGDEFVIVTERVLDPTIASRLAGKILDSVQCPFVVDSKTTLRVTASIGIAFFVHSGRSANDVLDEADSMLYAAKNGGRNQYLMSQWPCAEIPARPRSPER